MPPAEDEAVTADEVIAFYLPQFHPVPENDEFWGEGFTEWSNVRAGRPRYPGHHQPLVPTELGYYDLRSPEVRARQAELARAHGVTAFCYWHYWFGGRQVLEGPLREVVRLGRPDLPFCVGWANQSWTGVWHGAPDRVLIEQTYPGDDDHRRHFEALATTFADPRYLRVDGRPLLFVLEPSSIPDLSRSLDLWRRLADEAGLGGLYLVGPVHPRGPAPLDLGFDGAVALSFPSIEGRRERRPGPLRVPYEDVLGSLTSLEWDDRFPCVMPRWDNTPRSGDRGVVLEGATPERFREQVRRATGKLASHPPGRRLLWVKSWNEWAEGNMLEPDEQHGRAFLEALRDGLAHPAPPVRPRATVWRETDAPPVRTAVGDLLARTAAGEGPLRWPRQPTEQVVPVVLCVDCEPDPRMPPPGRGPDLLGFLQTVDLLDRWRVHAADLTGAPVRLNWLFRIDSQMARCYGSATALLDRHPDPIERLRDGGDGMGIHPHSFAWDGDRSTWFGDFAPSSLLENLDLALEGFASAFGHPPELLRYGDSVLSDEVVARAEAAGVRFDLTVEPGRPPQPLPEVDEWANDLQPDWTRVPREPYAPDPADYRRPRRSGGRSITMLPLTSGRRWPGTSVRRRVGAIRRNGFRHRRQGELLYMALPGWHGRDSFDRVVQRAIVAQRRPYLAFALRSDRVLQADRWRRIERCLFDLLALRDRHRLVFCTPAEACALLGAGRGAPATQQERVAGGL